MGEEARVGEVPPAPPFPAGGLKITVPVLESPASSDDVVPDDVLGDVQTGDTPPLGAGTSSEAAAGGGGDSLPDGVESAGVVGVTPAEEAGWGRGAGLRR